MNKYSVEDRIFMVKLYYKTGENVTNTLNWWSVEFTDRPKPNRGTIQRLIQKFERTGSVLDDVEARKRKPRTPKQVEEGGEIVNEQPSISVRK